MTMKVKSVCVPLDPDDCGSVISGYVRYPEVDQRDWDSQKEYINYDAKISLSDCSKVINWSFYLDEKYGGYNLAKIDRAIAALTELRWYMDAAQHEYLELKKAVDARNEAKKKEGGADADLQLPLSDLRDNL